jgi:hypothetical protein
MRRISSRWTFFYKRVFPLFWFGILLVSVIGAWLANRKALGAQGALWLVPVVIGVFGFVLWRLVFDLVDEVQDEGDAIMIRNFGVEERLALKNIINIGYSQMTTPERITLTLRDPCPLGKEITFMPLMRFRLFSRSPIIGELIERVDSARG